MKKLALLLLVFVGFMACENGIVQEQPQETFTTEGIIASGIYKIDVCHFDEDNDSWHLINISTSAWEAHEKHGDIILIDEDGDGWVSFENECVDGGDCDDTNPNVNPGEEEIVYNGLDDDCNPLTLDDDLDEDGFLNAYDCDDNDNSVYPGAEEICGDGIDQNCDGIDEECPTSCVVDGELQLEINPDGILNNGDEYTLYVHPDDQAANIRWGEQSLNIPELEDYYSLSDALQDFDGQGNTDKIYNELSLNQNVTYEYAAKTCIDLAAETGCDWYLPSLGELNAMNQEFGPKPYVGTYQMIGNYWSSTETNIPVAWATIFSSLSGGNQTYLKHISANWKVRCVRK